MPGLHFTPHRGTASCLVAMKYHAGGEETFAGVVVPAFL